jgi:polyhydroxyalkanoate synthase
MNVYVVEWTDPRRRGRGFGLDEYADRMLRDCLTVVADRTGQSRIPVMGHSLGGTIAAVSAALHPELVEALVLLEAPMHFGDDASVFAPMLAISPHVGQMRTPGRPVPGSFLNIVSLLAAPMTFQLARYVDLMLSLADPARLGTHLAVERWTLDELPVPGRLFEDVVERLYRRDQFMAGTLKVGSRQIGPAALTTPLLTVLNPHSQVAPVESVLPFHRAAASRRKQLTVYEGDVGVAIQHVGVLVGRTAHRRLWPAVLRWLDEVCGGLENRGLENWEEQDPGAVGSGLGPGRRGTPPGDSC